MPIDDSSYPYTHPAPQIKALDVDPPAQYIVKGLKKYEAAARKFDVFALERVNDAVFVLHRPENSQVPQVYRMPTDPDKGSIERLTYFDIASGRTIAAFIPIDGDDWRGIWRHGGAIMIMDIDGNENFQLWRYWEDATEPSIFPRISGELDNKPGRGRIERLTHDNFRYSDVLVSPSSSLLAFTSNRENGKDTLIYTVRLRDSVTDMGLDAKPFSLVDIAQLVTPLPAAGTKGTARFDPKAISLDNRYLVVATVESSSHRPLFILDLSSDQPARLERLEYPGATENENETVGGPAVFSRDPSSPYVLYVVTDAYGDFRSVIALDLITRIVTHITTPEPSLHALRAIPWDVPSLRVTSSSVIFRVNVDGWYVLYVMPLEGPHKGQVVEVKLEWEGGVLTFETDRSGAHPNMLILKLTSHSCSGRIAHVDLSSVLAGQGVEKYQDGNLFASVKPQDYQQATPVERDVRSIAPELIRFKSFDSLEVPCIYYHPHERKTITPVLIQIHGGPASQATVQYRTAAHGYLLNELGCAIIYPNVRGSIGYGKRYMSADDKEKREDSVKDIGALLDHIAKYMQNELDAARVAVMGGSYGGYMVFACLVHFSPKLTCGLANFGIAHWPSFLERTAAHRRDNRRKEYGDESDPVERAMLERISPLNRANEIAVPLQIAHGETDSRVPIEEALSMYDTVRARVHTELMVCEKEGHGFKQKSVIEFTNAAKVSFLERFLFKRS